MVISDEKDEKEKRTMSDTKVQRWFLRTSFSGFQIIVGETIWLYFFTVSSITLTFGQSEYNLCTFHQKILVLAQRWWHYDQECWKRRRLKGLHLLHSLVCSLMGMLDTKVQRSFLWMWFSGFQIIVGETFWLYFFTVYIFTLTQIRRSEYIFFVHIITLTQIFLSVNQNTS